MEQSTTQTQTNCIHRLNNSPNTHTHSRSLCRMFELITMCIALKAHKNPTNHLTPTHVLPPSLILSLIHI